LLLATKARNTAIRVAFGRASPADGAIVAEAARHLGHLGLLKGIQQVETDRLPAQGIGSTAGEFTESQMKRFDWASLPL